MTQSLKIKWRIQAVFLCVRLVIIFAPVLIAAHTANNADFDGEPEGEDYESKGTQNLAFTWPREIK